MAGRPLSKRLKMDDSISSSVNSKKKLYCIGTADPGTGEEDGFFFTPAQLKKIVDDDDLINLKVWFEHGDKTKQNIGRIVYTWYDIDCDGSSQDMVANSHFLSWAFGAYRTQADCLYSALRQVLPQTSEVCVSEA